MENKSENLLKKINTKTLSFDYRIEDNKYNNDLEKAKALLKNILKNKLDEKLVNIELNTKSHFVIIDNTRKLANLIENKAKQYNKLIEEKNKADKKNSRLKINRNMFKKVISPTRNTINNTRSNLRAKTIEKKEHANRQNRMTMNGRSKTTYNLLKNSRSLYRIENNTPRDNKSRGRSLPKKTKSSLNINKYNYNNVDDLQTESVTSIQTNKTNKTNPTNLNTIINSRINKNYKLKKQITETNLKKNLNKSKESKVSKNSKMTIDRNMVTYNNKKTTTQKGKFANVSELYTDEKKNKRKKTPFNKKNLTNGNNLENQINKLTSEIKGKKQKKTIEEELNDILYMESNIQNEQILNNNDPLLILPFKELDFVPKMLLIKRDSLFGDDNSNKKYNLSSFDIIKESDKIKFNEIFKFIGLNDLLSMKNISKHFHKLIILYLIEVLKDEMIEVNKIKNELNIEGVPPRNGMENIELSKGSKKALQLLNESLLNHLFKDDKLPREDIIFIYRIYFQMISHNNAFIAKSNIIKFWEKCKLYFTKEQNGKTGDVLESMITDNKIEINGDNLYQIYNLVRGKLNKIVPTYFSNICGTTGLFSFIIKDILEFLGFSLKIKYKQNAYWTYNDISQAINMKINHLNQWKI